MTNIDNELFDLSEVVDKCLESGEWSWEDETTISLDGTNIKLKVIE